MSASTPASSPAAPARLVSLDALRGFDMFWILGADALVRSLRSMQSCTATEVLADQLSHKAWAGFAFYDLIFPLFVFIVGVSLVFSLTRQREQYGPMGALKRVLRRAALLFVIGLFYSGGVSTAWPDIRVLGVLPRIALAYAGAGLLFCFFRPRTLTVIAAGLLVGYWALLTYVPIRNFQLERKALAAQAAAIASTATGTNVAPKETAPDMAWVRERFNATTERVTGKYEPGLNLTNHLDFQYLPGRRYDTYYDPEGLLSTFPAIATCLLGVLAGVWLRREDRTAAQLCRGLAIAGAVALALGYLWGLQFPVVKKLWTSSFVLVAGGWSLLLLAAFYYVVDIRLWRGWCQPFIWIGMNPITLYLISGIVGYRKLATRIAGGDVKTFFDSFVGRGCGDMVLTLTGLALMFLLARFLYQRKIFLRV